MVEAYISDGSYAGYLVDGKVFVHSGVVHYAMQDGFSVDGVVYDLPDGVLPLYVGNFGVLPDDISRRFLFVIEDVNESGFRYGIYGRDGRRLGYLLLDSNLYASRDVIVRMLYLERKNEGLGTEVLKQLMAYGLVLRGVSVPQARHLWERLGAEFDGDKKFVLRGGASI